MHFCAQEQCKSLANGDLLAGGPLPLAADEMLQHLLCEAMAAGCWLPLANLDAAGRTLARLQSFVQAPQGMMGLGPFATKSPPSHHWSKTAQQFYVLIPNVIKEPDVCIWISLSHLGFMPCNCLCGVMLSYLPPKLSCLPPKHGGML